MTNIVRNSFVGKRFIKGDAFIIDIFDHYRDAPFIYKDIDDDFFMSIGGKFYLKSQVKEIELKSIWSKIVWWFQ